jgi:hypothetical protein
LQIPVAGAGVAFGVRSFKQMTGSPAHSADFSQEPPGAIVPAKTP